MNVITLVLVVAIGTTGLLGAWAIGNAEPIPRSAEGQSISGNTDAGTKGGDGAPVTGNQPKDEQKAPAGEITKTDFKKDDAGTMEDGPSNKNGFHKWIERWDDCKKKEQLERQYREQLERQK